MTREEAIKVLTILKAAYPASYKGITKEDANAVINIWAVQFKDYSFNVVSVAIYKLISTNVFPPTISEVKKRIQGLYWEAWGMLNSHKQGFEVLDTRNLKIVTNLLEETEKMRTNARLEPSLSDLLNGFNNYLEDGNDKKLID